MTATRILVIDDEELVRQTVVAMLDRLGYEAVEAAHHEVALALLDDPAVRLVVSDIVMPELDGFELTEAVRQRRPTLPVLLITGARTDANLQEALARGAAGLIPKPFSLGQLEEAVVAVLGRAERSEQDVRRRTVPGVLADVLSGALEARDHSIGGHSDRLSGLAERLAERLGLGRADLETVALGALLHDIGKIGIPDSILLKPGPLDAQELAVMRAHALIGDRLLVPFPELGEARAVVRSHHERWDGGGYPDGLAGEQIPFAARIVAVADAIEAMSQRRPYRDALSLDVILAELERGRGSQWDARVVDCALELLRDGTPATGRPPAPTVSRTWGEAELAAFAESRVLDLVRLVAHLDGVLDAEALAGAEAAGAGGSAFIPARRREALGVLQALQAALKANGHP